VDKTSITKNASLVKIGEFTDVRKCVPAYAVAAQV
jgi:hypothetical protein